MASQRTRRFPSSLTPLAAALAACWPLWAGAAAPAPNTVPVPAAHWRVYGQGGALVSKSNTTTGGIDLTINQKSDRAIYQWQSFDIGAKSSVTFEMKTAGASALNRVLGSTAPSQIFGKLSATNGGEIYLINANGILFGKGATVNTGSLIASALNITDEEFKSGLTNNLLYTPRTPAFQYDGDAANFIDSKNFVRVDQGATITTDNGGRVFLFAKRVDNAGTIDTPGGQTMLAAGGQIYLQQPSSNQLYASEADPNVPILRGLLVEVGAGPADAPEGMHGSVTNQPTGVINTARGNATLVGMAVNQMGLIRATTSVTENGSIILRAQGDADPSNSGSTSARAAGALVLGQNSQTLIDPDEAKSDSGVPLTSDGNATFVSSQINLAGASVLLDKGAQVVAPGAIVDVRAEAVPSYNSYGEKYFSADASDSSRIVLADGAAIDVSGTTGSDSVSRFFVTTGLLGSNDLKDAPIQKDGLLYRSKVTVDVREDSALLGSLETYRDGLQQTIEERLSAGGQVRLTAGSAVLTHANSRIDVSGGQMNYSAAEVRETQLIGSDGRLYDLNSAPADLVYSSALNLQKGSLAGYDRWGVKVNYGSLTPTQHEEGYVEGRAAGSVSVVAPTVVLSGALQASTVTGTRQTSGQDVQASRGSFYVGAPHQGTSVFGDSGYVDAVLKNFSVTTQGPAIDDELWEDAATAALPEASGMQQDTLAQAGFGQVTLAANGDVSVLKNSVHALLDLGDQASLRLLSLDGDASLGGHVRSAGGSIELKAGLHGEARLSDGAAVELQGRFVNTLLDGPRNTDATVGGSFSAQGTKGVSLGAGSLVDVSGGAVVSSAGEVTGADAGSISLVDAAANSNVGAALEAPELVLGGTLKGQSLATGGTLSLSTSGMQLGGDAAAAEAADRYWVDPQLLQQGGFSSYVLTGTQQLEVAAGSTISLRRDEYQVDPRLAALASSGSDWRSLATAGPAAGQVPAPVSLTLKGSTVEVEEGARIEASAQASLQLSGYQVLMDGTLQTAGGKVSIEATGPLLWLGEHSLIDVSGTTLLTQTTNGLLQGQVLDGGSISLSSGVGAEDSTVSALVIQQGARLLARGASAELDRSSLTEGGVHWEHEQVDSNGGSLSISASRSLVNEGSFDLHAGGSQASGGSLSVSLNEEISNAGPDAPENALHELRIAAGPTEKTAGLAMADTAGIEDLSDTASISAAAIKASGAANLSLTARDRLRFLDGSDLDLAGSLTLSSSALVVQPGKEVQLSAGQVRLQGAGSATNLVAGEASTGSAELNIDSRDGLVLAGNWLTQGLARLSLSAGGDLMLQGFDGDNEQASLITGGDLRLQGRQIYVGTAVDFRIEAADHEVTLAGNGTAASAVATPLSAAGRLSIAADTITQGGVLRAPQGQIVLQGTESVNFLPGSETSVSAQGQVLPYGTGNADRWLTPGSDGTSQLSSLPTKRIEVDAPNVNVQAGASLDLSGGGDLVAYEFVPGRGGSTDVFAGGNGAYALVPSVHGAAVYDQSMAGAATQGRQIEIGSGGPVPAGTYTLLPARYALQPGAYLVEPVKSSTPLALNTAVTQTDGSVLVGARLSTAGTSIADSQTSTWRVSSSEVASKRSEVRATSGNTTFTDAATRDGVAAVERPMDAGTLLLAATQAKVNGSFEMGGAAASESLAAGQGGRAEFSASEIVVGTPEGGADEGALQLSVATLNNLGAQSVVLGGYTSATTAAADDTTSSAVALTVTADKVTVATAGETLTVPDLTLASNGQLSVEANSVLKASGTVASATTYSLQGDGAALRLSAAPGAGLLRQGTSQQAGTLAVAGHTVLDASGGSLLLDATQDAKIASSATLLASELSLGSPTLTLGAPQAGGTGVLALTPALLAQASQAEQLTLHGYNTINLKDGTVLGEAADGTPTLDKLVLDTPTLRAVEASGSGARITAGEITLANSSGLEGGQPQAGEGLVTLHASDAAGGSGDIRLVQGRTLVQGAAAVELQADHAIALAGQDVALATAGDLTLRSRGVVAEVAGSDATLQAGGKVLIASLADSVAPASALGGAFSVSGSQIEMDGRIVLPAGNVSLSAQDGLVLGAGSRIDVSGRTAAVGEATVDLGGGNVSLTTEAGDLDMQGGVINVSAAGSAEGGQLTLAAPQGAVQVQGQLVGTSQGLTGAELTVDSGAPLDLGSLAQHMGEDEATSFAGAIRVQQRSGDLTVDSQTQLSAHEIELSADGGALTVHGTLDARGADGGRITLASRDALTLASGASLLASAQAADETGDGGRVELSATSGTLQLQQGGRIDVSGGAKGEAGRIQLRAARQGITEDNPAGAGVAIAALGSEILGAGRIDVQAVKVYDGITTLSDYAPAEEGTLLISTLAADGLAFVGANGSKAEQLAVRLAGGNEDLLSKLRIHAEAEVRSEGDMDVASLYGGTLAVQSEKQAVAQQTGGVATHVGDTSITLRAAGGMTVRSSIDAGFSYAGNSDAGGNLRFVAGADLNAASLTSVALGSKASLVVGQDGTVKTTIRTTTGDVTAVAAGDVNLVKGQTTLYSWGVNSQDDAALAAEALVGGQELFRIGGGDIRVVAGEAVRSRSVNYDNDAYYHESEFVAAHPNDWTMTYSTPELTYWYAQPDSYGAGLQHGLGSFGGGNIDVRAGTDVQKLTAAAPSSGFLDAEGSARTYGGGNVRVSAGRDVIDGVVQAGGRELTVRAGRDVAWEADPKLYQTSGLVLAHENTTVDVSARRDLTLGSDVSSHALNGEWISGLDGDASLSLKAAGGDLSYRGDLEPVRTDLNYIGETANLLPTQVLMAAPSGSLSLGGSNVIQQAEGPAASLDLLAAEDLTLSGQLQVNASWSQGTGFYDNSGQDDTSLDGRGLPGSAWLALSYHDLSRGDGDGLDRTDRTPVRLIAANGDLTVKGKLRTARPARLIAGRDLVFDVGSSGLQTLEIQQQAQRLDDAAGAVDEAELSLLQAGRDVVLGYANLRIAGPGDLVVLAGRDIDLGKGSGIQAAGNVDNSTRLPEGSANLTLVAGLQADGADYLAAASRGYEVLGATALTERAADIYALLSAADGQTPALGSAEAQAFKALGTDAQLAKVQALLGDEAYQAAVTRYVHGLVGHETESASQAQQTFASLSAVKRAAAPGTMLAEALGEQPASKRLPFLAAVATADASDGATELIEFMRQQTGQTLALEDALAAFEALPLERQLLRLNAVLVDELRTQGREAVNARLTDDKEAAYDRGYAAINALFPADDRPAGDISLPSTQLRTLQGSSITLLTPGGSMNAGETGTSTKSASELGIVTVAGGSIDGVAHGDILVNQSRIFTLAEGDILLWSSTGDVDAGRGAKTVASAQSPVYRLDDSGHIVVDTSGSFSGSGIAVLDADSALDLYAPAGAIDAGEAGIRALGTVTLGAQVVRGADDIVGGTVVGAPPAAPTVGVTAGLSQANDATASAARAAGDDEEERRRKRRARRQLLLEFLGFGQV